MHPRRGETMRQQIGELLGRRHPVTDRAVALGVFHEIGVAIGQAEIGKAHVGLLPADHPVSVIAQDQHREIEAEAHRGLHLLAVHHETAVAADRHDLAVGIQHRRHHRARQARTHRRQRIIEQHGVGEIGIVPARKPDLVDPVVQADDPVFGHRAAHLTDQMRREDREARVGGERRGVGNLARAIFEHPAKVPPPWRDDVVLDLVDRVGDVADHLDMREIDRIDLGSAGRDVDDRRPALLHKERRLFDHVVADVDDAIRVLDRAVHEISGGQRRAAQEQRMALVDHALAHLCGDEGNAGLVDQLAQHPPGHLAVSARADH